MEGSCCWVIPEIIELGSNDEGALIGPVLPFCDKFEVLFPIKEDGIKDLDLGAFDDELIGEQKVLFVEFNCLFILIKLLLAVLVIEVANAVLLRFIGLISKLSKF